METIPIEVIKKANNEAGMHYFEPDTMRFFRSKIGAYGYGDGKGGAYFVTSEKNTGFGGPYPRLYSVRRADLSTGRIETIGEFQEFKTRGKAERQAERLAKSGGVENGIESQTKRG